jgi:hypothetical protein
MKMDKLDFKKQYKKFYSASKNIEVVDVPEFLYLSADGEGNPNTTPAFQEVTNALYSLSYTIKFTLKKTGAETDYAVPPLEGLWWMDNPAEFSESNKEQWKWTLMIAQPGFITKELFRNAQDEVLRKKKLDTSFVKLDKFREGESIQLLHIGSYSGETENISRMHKFIYDNGYAFNGKHHEIYLSDPRKTAPEKLKTILRQPVKKK